MGGAILSSLRVSQRDCVLQIVAPRISYPPCSSTCLEPASPLSECRPSVSKMAQEVWRGLRSAAREYPSVGYQQRCISQNHAWEQLSNHYVEPGALHFQQDSSYFRT